MDNTITPRPPDSPPPCGQSGACDMPRALCQTGILLLMDGYEVWRTLPMYLLQTKLQVAVSDPLGMYLLPQQLLPLILHPHTYQRKATLAWLPYQLPATLLRCYPTQQS